MILEHLTKAEPDIWNAITVVLRGGYYLTSLGAAGLALFLAGFGRRMSGADEDWLRYRVVLAAVLAILLSLGAVTMRAHVLSAGDLTDLDVWRAMLRSRQGDSLYAALAGLLLIVLGAMRWPIAPALAGIGATLAIGSYVMVGHTTLYAPRQELAVVVLIHLACVAFWSGSLWPLARIARGGGAAAALIVDWSRVALFVVPLLVASGLYSALLLVQKPEMLLTSRYGNALLAKVTIVALVMALAAWHKLVLTRRLEHGAAGSADRLNRSIRIEMIMMALVFYAAAEMVTVHPVDLGHRLPA
jgi:copper resistance protein D